MFSESMKQIAGLLTGKNILWFLAEKGVYNKEVR